MLFQPKVCRFVCLLIHTTQHPPCKYRYGSEPEADEDEEAGVSNAARDKIYDKGQSRRIWGELYKVVDSSDVIVQVHPMHHRMLLDSHFCFFFWLQVAVCAITDLQLA